MLKVFVVLAAVFALAVPIGDANAQSLKKRVKKVETQVDYYKKKNKFATKTKTKGDPGLSSTEGCTDGPNLKFDVSTKDVTAHVWVYGTVKYSSNQSKYISMRAYVASTTHACKTSEYITGKNGKVDLKSFCSFSVPKNTPVTVDFVTGNCMTYDELTVETKMTTIHVLEPEQP